MPIESGLRHPWVIVMSGAFSICENRSMEREAERRKLSILVETLHDISLEFKRDGVRPQVEETA